MTALTIFLARLIGLFAILVSLSMVLHKRVMVETTTALLRNGPLLLITGMVGLVAGLAMVLSHNIWSGGALPVVVTLNVRRVRIGQGEFSWPIRIDSSRTQPIGRYGHPAR
jgi:uncharacterized membrane protein HdeD (DUF308 family)